MSPIPGEPLHRVGPELGELTTKDGRKVKLKLPGTLPQPMKPSATEERGAQEPPHENPAPRHNPLHGT